MKINGEEFSLYTFRRWLEERGIKIPRGTSSMSSMRLWLEKAKVITSDSWDIDQEILQKTLGTSSENIDELATLSEEQRSYLKTIANLSIKDPIPSNEIEKLATQLYGTRFNEKELPKRVLYPLQELGYITIQKQTGGRGAKPFLVSATDKIEKSILAPILGLVTTLLSPVAM